MSVGAIPISEAAKLFRVSESTIDREIKDGKLVSIKIRGARRVTMKSIERWQRELEEASRTKNANQERFVNPHF